MIVRYPACRENRENKHSGGEYIYPYDISSCLFFPPSYRVGQIYKERREKYAEKKIRLRKYSQTVQGAHFLIYDTGRLFRPAPYITQHVMITDA